MMYAQLGSIVFKGLYGFSDLSFSGNEAVLSELELVNQKPTLQKTGDTLIEISASITMRIEFCNPKQQIEDLLKYKSEGEVLPLLMGDGSYVGDFVIVSLPYTVDDAFGDGTIIQATVDLSLKEYVSNNKLEQKQIAARKNAIAIGDKNPVVVRNLQPPTLDKQASLDIAAVKQQTFRTDSLVQAIESNPPAKAVNAEFLKDSLLKSKSSLNNLIKKIESNVVYFSQNPSLKTAAIALLNTTDAMLNAYPFNDIPFMKSINSALQINGKGLSTISNSLLQKIIIRKP